MFEAVPLNWTLLARNAIIFHSVIWLSTYNQILLIFSIRYLCTYSKSPPRPVKVDLIQKVLSAHSLVFIFLSIMSNMWFRLFLSSHVAHMIFHALFTWFGLFFIVCHTSCVEWLKEDSFLNSSFPQIHSFICIWIIHSGILHFLKKYPGKLFSFFHSTQFHIIKLQVWERVIQNYISSFNEKASRKKDSKCILNANLLFRHL